MQLWYILSGCGCGVGSLGRGCASIYVREYVCFVRFVWGVWRSVCGVPWPHRDLDLHLFGGRRGSPNHTCLKSILIIIMYFNKMLLWCPTNSKSYLSLFPLFLKLHLQAPFVSRVDTWLKLHIRMVALIHWFSKDNNCLHVEFNAIYKQFKNDKIVKRICNDGHHDCCFMIH